jgi:hypothetical protein
VRRGRLVVVDGVVDLLRDNDPLVHSPLGDGD